MTRATIVGVTPHAKKMHPDRDEPSHRSDVDAGGDTVLVDQFTREFQAVLRQVKDAQGDTSDDARFSADGDVQAEKRSVAYYGVTSQRLLALVRRLVDRTPELAVDKKAQLLLHMGNKFVALYEYQAADRYFYNEIVALSVKQDEGESCRTKDDVYVRAVFGQAMSRFQLAKRADPIVRFPGTLERLLASLQLLQHGMEIAVELECTTPHSLAWLLLNGSILVYSVARPLQTLGFEREVVTYFKWCLLCLESTVMLSTTKYILWRLQIYSAVCECLERLAYKRPKKASAYLQSALACTEHAAKSVARLRKEEEMDLPLPKSVVATLLHAETIADGLVARARSTAKGEEFERKMIESSPRFQETRDRLWFSIDALNKTTQSTDNSTTTAELFDFALELAQPLIHPLLDTAISEDAVTQQLQVLNNQLPTTLHLSLIRHAYRLQKWAGAVLLIEAAKTRIGKMKELDPIVLELNLWSALTDFDRPVDTDENGNAVTDNLLVRQRALATAKAVVKFVVCIHGSVPITLRDLLIGTAMRLWREGAVDILRELDESTAPESLDLDLQLGQHAVFLLEAIYTILRAVNFDDMIVLGEVCMRLSLILNVQENRRKAIRILRDFLVLVNTFRDQLVGAPNHFSAVDDTGGHSLSRASFSFDVNPDSSKSDCYLNESSLATFSRRTVGVEGTGSQLGSIHQEIACIQVDALMLMYQIELDEAAAMDANESESSSTPPAQVTATRRPSLLTSIENALQKEYKKNLYARALLNIQLLRQVGDGSSSHAQELVDECFELLNQAEVQERELTKVVNQQDDHSTSHAETTIPRAPRILMRCSSSVTVEVIPFKPSSTAARPRPIAYYMLFGKPAGAGTDVSLNNADFPGTGEPLYAPVLCKTVSGLSPNTSYVFAIAAFDDQGEVIEGIGATSKSVVALNPLPLVACYGYLAQICDQIKLLQPARKAAMRVYNRIVSKEFEGRPGWASNFFYRHALKRAVIARWPLPLLDHAVQCILVLCDTEDGDAFCDGQLTSDGLLLRSRQIATLEASKMVAIGLEIACAAADYEQIRALCFKGYRILLPLLHLDDSNALAFAALSTFYQALWCSPTRLWDTDTQSIAARIAFELLRIAWRHHHLVDATYGQVAKLKTHSADTLSSADTPMIHELAALLDSIALTECLSGRSLVHSPSDSRPATATTSTQPSTGKSTGLAAAGGSKAPTAAASPSPPTTARAPEKTPLPRLSELMDQSKLSVREAFKLLEPFFKTSLDALEVFCKLCHCAITAGDEDTVEEWMEFVKVTGNVGTNCKETLKSVGLGHVLPEPAPSPPTPISAPTTARTTTKTPRGQDVATPSVPTETSYALTTPEPELGDDDNYVYTWCGEICLMQAKAQLHKLARHRAEHDEADCLRGPRYNYAFAILNDKQASESAIGAATMDQTNPSVVDGETAQTETPRSLEEGETSLALFKTLMSRTAASCRLFSLAETWQALQTVAQYAANSIWLAWVSPETLRLHEHASTLDDLVVCANSLLYMIEFVSAALKEEQSGKTPTTLIVGSDVSKLSAAIHNPTLSMASTTVIISALSSLSADQTWISNLLEFTIQALLAAKQWHKVVQIGKKYHLLSGGGTRFSEKMFPLLVFAQQQHLSEQTDQLESAEAETAAFIKAFNDAEAKKKKKKSRLVVEEVLTPEEIDFRSKKDGMYRHIQELAHERKVRQQELDALNQMLAEVSRTTNKCTQAIDNCHGLVERYRRFGDASVKPQQVVNAFSHCVALCRQKRQRRLAGKALQELGDFFWDRGDAKSAVKTWHEAIDNAFNALRATNCWREIIGLHVEEKESTAGDALIEGDGLWICLESCGTMAKLIMFDSLSDTPTLELACMAAATVTRIITKSSLPLPSRSYLFGFHQLCSQIWPGRELLVDAERLDAPRLALMFIVTIQTLLQYEHPVEAMPLIAAYEYVSTQCFEDIDHVANSRRLRLDALVPCGRIHEALQVLAILLTETNVNREEKPRVSNALASKLRFRDDKPIKDSSNSDVLVWLTSVDVPKIVDDLVAHHCKPATARLIILSMLKLVVSLAQREPIEEEAASTLRQIASKLASSIVGLLTKTLDLHQQLPIGHLDEESTTGISDDSQASISLDWELLTLHHTHAEVLLQQSVVAASGGQWEIAQELCTQTIQVAIRSRTALEQATQSLGSSSVLSLDRALPPAFLYKPTTLVIRTRLLSAKMDMAQEKYPRVVKQVQLAIDEARSQGEQMHYVRQLELLRAEALVLLGSREAAVLELSTLRDAFVSSHSCDCLSYVELVRVLAFVLRSQAMEGLDASSTLQRVLSLLEEAEAALDRLLRRDGWIGVDVDVATDKRMSLFNPSIVAFVQLKAEIAQALMEMPTPDPKGNGTRMRRALLSIDSALKAADHSIKSLAPTKARLLLQKGVILKKLVIGNVEPSRRDDLFDQCSTSLLACVEEAIRMDGGGHDRELMRLAFMELVGLYGAKLVEGKEPEHLQAAFHYLNLALLVRSHQRILFDSAELQAGTLVSTDKLPAFVTSAVLHATGVTDLVAAEPPRATPLPMKGGKEAAAPQAVLDTSKKSTIDATRLVNFFVNIVRSTTLLPPCNGLQEDVAVLIHAFLVQNHSTYAKVCCLPSIPVVPQDDPEIKGGIICTQWMRDLAPAFTQSTESLERSAVTLFFTLGTTRVDGHSELADNDDSMRSRDEYFATSPLLSKRFGVLETDVRDIGEMVSRLRIDMEDEDSLVVDRATFLSRFNSILHQIQRTFRRSTAPLSVLDRAQALDRRPDEEDRASVPADATSSLILDSFNVIIPVNGTLDTVKILEAMFHFDLGVNNAIDNALCYFLRDLLDN